MLPSEVERAVMNDFTLIGFFFPFNENMVGLLGRKIPDRKLEKSKPGQGLECVVGKRASEREKESERDLLEVNLQTAVRQSGAAKMFSWIW